MQRLTVVRLRQDFPRGTIVEELDENTVLVEFTDEQGRTLELLPVARVLLTQVIPALPNPRFDVEAVEALPGFVLRLTFENGEVRRFSMAKLLAGEATVFAPLRKVEMFRRVFVAHGTVCWPGGTEIDPESLYAQSVRECEEPSEKERTGEVKDSRRHAIGIPEGQCETPDDESVSGYPVDTAWENMPEIGLEKWPDGEQENNE